MNLDRFDIEGAALEFESLRQLPNFDAEKATRAIVAVAVRVFPTDEDVEIVAASLAYPPPRFTQTKRRELWGRLDEAATIRYRDKARAALQAVADARRTEEEV